MKRIKTGLLLLLLAPLLTACVVAIGDPDRYREEDNKFQAQAKKNSREIQQLKIGQSTESVLTTLGAPDFSEAFVRNGQQFRVYFYRTHQVHTDSRTTKDETTPLVFVNDSLVGWGDTAILHATVD